MDYLSHNPYRMLATHIKPRSALRSLTSGVLLIILFAVSGPLIHRFVHADLIGVMPVPPPTNIRIDSEWIASQSSGADNLSWDVVPEATSYNVYQYDKLLLRGITTASHQFASGQRNPNMTYTVTSVTASGQESIPSNLAYPLYVADPNNVPNWVSPTAPNMPKNVSVKSQWNVNAPRNLVTWDSTMSTPADVNGRTADTYAVYRDGKLLASGMWDLYYIDASVQPGKSYSYTVVGINAILPSHPITAQTVPVTVISLTASPVMLAQKVNVTGVQRNNDSDTVYFDPVPGALDYRIYKTSSQHSVKYAGQYYVKNTGLYCGSSVIACNKPGLPESYSIELNNVDTVNGNDVVVEAVDELGPFQIMDGVAGPGAILADGLHMSTNGQGDPSNVPNVLASSDIIHLTTKSRSLTGAQVFFDSFTNAQPLVQTPTSSLDPAIIAYQEGNNFAGMTEFTNNKWKIRDYRGDHENTKFFFMNNHFMDTLYDGPVASNAFSHNNNASTVMMPKATADISGGKILHWTMEVDAHNDGRRWSDVLITQAGQSLLRADPSKIVLSPKGTGVTSALNEIDWAINNNQNTVEQFVGRDLTGTIMSKQLVPDPSTWSYSDRLGQDGMIENNGSAIDIDKRHVFDLFLSQNRLKIYEAGVMVKDAQLAQPLGFSNIQVYATHELYHTSNDRGELLSYNGSPEQYWYNFRPWSDERHWDNMGQEVLADWSQVIPTVLPIEAPVFLGTPTPNPTSTPTPNPTSTPTPNPTPPVSTLCVKLPSQPLSNVSISVTSGSQAPIITFPNLVAINGQLTITDSVALAKLNDTSTYQLTVSPLGYLPLSLQVAHVLTTCAIFPTNPPLLVGDFNGDKKITLIDIVTMIRMFNGSQAVTPAEQVVQILFGAHPALGNLVTVIRNYQTTLLP